MTELTLLPGFECKDLEETQEGDSTNDPTSSRTMILQHCTDVYQFRTSAHADSDLNGDDSREKSSSIEITILHVKN